MQPFETLTGVAAPLLRNDVNTDQIAPTQHTGELHPDYSALLFSRWRVREDGTEDPDFVLNQPQFRQAKILVVGDNFGCGSSRESAVWAMSAYGIRCIVARGFADIYRDNCLKNGILPVVLPPEQATALERLVVEVDGGAPFTADLRSQRILTPDGRAMPFDTPAEERIALLEGLDDIGLTLKCADAIAAWEDRTRHEKPWLQELRDSRT